MGLQDFFGPKEAVGEACWHCKIEPVASMLLFALGASAMEECCGEAARF